MSTDMTAEKLVRGCDCPYACDSDCRVATIAELAAEGAAEAAAKELQAMIGLEDA